MCSAGSPSELSSSSSRPWVGRRCRAVPVFVIPRDLSRGARYTGKVQDRVSTFWCVLCSLFCACTRHRNSREVVGMKTHVLIRSGV